jgi:hypothetical protein
MMSLYFVEISIRIAGNEAFIITCVEQESRIQ